MIEFRAKMSTLADVGSTFAVSKIGAKYVLGGDGFGPVNDQGGYDCSGLVLDTLVAMGVLPSKKRLDFTANSLFTIIQNHDDMKRNRECEGLRFGVMEDDDSVTWKRDTGPDPRSYLVASKPMDLYFFRMRGTQTWTHVAIGITEGGLAAIEANMTTTEVSLTSILQRSIQLGKYEIRHMVGPEYLHRLLAY